MRKACILVEDDLNEMGRSVKEQKTADMKDITYHPQHPVMLQFGGRCPQPAACPHTVTHASKTATGSVTREAECPVKGKTSLASIAEIRTPMARCPFCCRQRTAMRTTGRT